MERNLETFGMMFSSGNSKYHNKNASCDVLTFVPSERPDMIEQLKGLNFRADPNYADIDWYEFVCISVMLKQDTVMGFSSVWHRPKYYQHDEVRILNRWWEHESLREHGMEIARPHVIASVDHQMQMSKQLGYNKAFISRERNPRFFKKLINTIGDKTNTKWYVFKDKQCVCMPKASSCWQYKGETIL